MRDNHFSQFDEDGYRLPEGMRRIAYDADTERYTFRDESGQLYEGDPGARYGVLQPVGAPRAHRRNVTITEVHGPALRRWSGKPAKTFDDILPSSYIAAARPGGATGSAIATSPTRIIRFSGEKLVQLQAATLPKVQGVAEVMRRRTTMGRFTRSGAGGGGNLKRSESVMEEKRRLLEEDWEVVSRDEVFDGRLGRSKSEMRPSRYHGRK